MQCAATVAAVDHALQSDGIFTAQPVDDQNNRCGAPLRLTHPAGYTGRRDSIKLVLQPEEAQLDVGTGHILIATASMSDTGKPITNTLVHFAVNGLNHAVGISKTDSSGQATFAYFGGVNITVTNQLTETDQISAWIDLNNDQQLQLGTEPVASTTAIWHRIDVGICHDEGGTAETPLRHLTVKVTRYPEDPKANCERPTHPVIGAEVNLLVTDGTAYGPEAKRITDTGVVNFTYVSNAPQAAAGQARTLRAAAADTVQPGAILSPTQATGNTDLVSVWVELNQNRRLDPTEPFDLAEVSTAVQLVAFTAQVEGAAVVLRWTTAVEIDNAGYNLYRSSTLDGEYAQVNAQFIGAQGEGYGATYQFVDTPPASGQYFYKLVAISNRNVRTIYPPQPIQFAPQPPGNLAILLYLPLIQR